MGKGSNRHFSREDIQAANKHTKTCSPPWVIRETATQVTRCHFTPTRMAVMMAMTMMACPWEGGDSGTLSHFWREYKTVRSLWESLAFPSTVPGTFLTLQVDCLKVFWQYYEVDREVGEGELPGSWRWGYVYTFVIQPRNEALIEWLLHLRHWAWGRWGNLSREENDKRVISHSKNRRMNLLEGSTKALKQPVW